MILASCSKEQPDYLIKGARDNGFVPAYRAYFTLTDGNIKKVSENKFDSFIHSDKIDHEYLGYGEIHTFDAVAVSADPSEWEYEQNKFDDVIYDTDILIQRLKNMELDYTGDVYIIITEFDDYSIIQADSLNGNTVLNTHFALFKDGEKLDLPKGIDLSSINEIYRMEY